MNPARQTWAAIFDWDGVIINSSRQHEIAWEQLAAEQRRTLPPGFFLKSFGMKNDRVIAELLGWTTERKVIQRLSLHKEALYRKLVRREGIEPLPGVMDWLDQLHAASIPCAIASSTPRKNIDCIIDGLGLRDHFQAIIAAEDVTQGKPHPEVFLLAARQLGIVPRRCLVFEDAHVGIAAARAAGMRVIAVATTHPAASLHSADRVARRLNELKLAEINRWFARLPRVSKRRN